MVTQLTLFGCPTQGGIVPPCYELAINPCRAPVVDRAPTSPSTTKEPTEPGTGNTNVSWYDCRLRARSSSLILCHDHAAAAGAGTYAHTDGKIK